MVRKFKDDRYQKLFERIEKELDVTELTPEGLKEFMGEGAFRGLSPGIRQSILSAFIEPEIVVRKVFVVIRGKRQARYRDSKGRFAKAPK